MATLNEAIEIVKDRHLIKVLEEGTVSELGALKTKKFLTENLNLMRHILVEEGVVDNAKAHLANNWGKYAAGVGALGAGLGAAYYYGGEGHGGFHQAVENQIEDLKEQLANPHLTDAEKAAITAKIENLSGKTPNADYISTLNRLEGGLEAGYDKLKDSVKSGWEGYTGNLKSGIDKVFGDGTMTAKEAAALGLTGAAGVGAIGAAGYYAGRRRS